MIPPLMSPNPSRLSTRPIGTSCVLTSTCSGQGSIKQSYKMGITRALPSLGGFQGVAEFILCKQYLRWMGDCQVNTDSCCLTFQTGSLAHK